MSRTPATPASPGAAVSSPSGAAGAASPTAASPASVASPTGGKGADAGAGAGAGPMSSLKVYVKEVTKESFTVIPARVTDTAAKLCETIAKRRGVAKDEAKDYSLWLQNSDPNDPFEQKLSADECPLEIADVLRRYEQSDHFKWFYSKKKVKSKSGAGAGAGAGGASGAADDDDDDPTGGITGSGHAEPGFGEPGAAAIPRDEADEKSAPAPAPAGTAAGKAPGTATAQAGDGAAAAGAAAGGANANANANTPLAASGSTKAKDGRAGGRYGYLSKRGVRNTGWKERWFVLEHGKLAYFRSKEHSSPISTIVVTDADIVALPPLVKTKDGVRRDPEYPFNVHTPDRIFYLKSRSQRDMMEWVVALKRHTTVDGDNAVIDAIQIACDEQQTENANADERESLKLRTLDGCLKNAQALDLFLHYLQLKRTEENLLFWSAAEEFRVRRRNPAERKAKGQDIFDRYIRESAEFDIGAKPADRAAAKAAIDKAEETALIQLQNKAFAQLEGDAFPQFMASDAFKRLLPSGRPNKSFTIELDEV